MDGLHAFDSDTLRDAILKSLDDDKAEDVVTVDLRGKSEMGDYMVIAAGRSTRQVAALAEKLVERVKKDFGVVSKIEGKERLDLSKAKDLLEERAKMAKKSEAQPAE